MRHHTVKWVTAVSACIAASLLYSQAATSAESGTQPSANDIDAAWKRRALTATKKLSRPGLDACDRAIERGFEQVKVTRSKDGHTYRMSIEIHGHIMGVAYVYQGNRLGEFVISALPQRWLAVQKTNSKTLAILVNDANCALDLCTNNPFSDGPCTEKRTR